MDIEVVQSTEAFLALRAEWNELLSRSGGRHIFLCHQWQYTWWKHFGSGDTDLLILLARDHGRLVGIAPLRRQRLRVRGLPLVRLISFLVGYEADYRDFLIEEGREWEVLQRLLGFLEGQTPAWQVLHLPGIRGASPCAALLPVLARRQGLHAHGEAAATCPFVALPEAGEAARLGPSAGSRREYGRKFRQLERERGHTHLLIHRGDQVTRDDVVTFLELHARGWERRGGSKAIHSASISRFHHDLVTSMKGTGWPLLSLLSVAGTPSAVIYGFLFEGVLYDYLPGHDPELARYSPGAQALIQTLEYGIREGWRELDLLRGDEGYKFHFTRCVRYTFDWYVCRSRAVQRVMRLLGALAT